MVDSKIIVMTRFGLGVNKQSYYDSDWYLFLHIFLKSLAYNSDLIDKIVVLTDINIPDKYIERIDRFGSKHSMEVLIHKHDPFVFNEFMPDISSIVRGFDYEPGCIISTIRLDSDDAISRSLLLKIKRISNVGEKSIIHSASNGLLYYAEIGKLVNVVDRKTPIKAVTSINNSQFVHCFQFSHKITALEIPENIEFYEYEGFIGWLRSVHSMSSQNTVIRYNKFRQIYGYIKRLLLYRFDISDKSDELIKEFGMRKNELEKISGEKSSNENRNVSKSAFFVLKERYPNIDSKTRLRAKVSILDHLRMTENKDADVLKNIFYDL